MPELPEVEVVRQQTEPLVKGRRIVRVLTRASSQVYLTPPGDFAERLVGRRVSALERRGKYLLFVLDNHSRFLVHLGMTGQLLASQPLLPRLVHHRGTGDAPGTPTPDWDQDRHVHLGLVFDRPGCQIWYRDPRRFGRLRALPPGSSDPRLDRLGPDALSITASSLMESGGHRRLCIKSLLLDQSVLAGVGNIYADESLFLAATRPDRRSDSLDERTWRTLSTAIRQTLRRAIVAGGSSIDDYVHPDGSQGAFQQRLKVYGRTDEPCQRCHTKIVRQIIGQRSSHFCPRCQR